MREEGGGGGRRGKKKQHILSLSLMLLLKLRKKVVPIIMPVDLLHPSLQRRKHLHELGVLRLHDVEHHHLRGSIEKVDYDRRETALEAIDEGVDRIVGLLDEVVLEG
jgi:hypothetical protein